LDAWNDYFFDGHKYRDDVFSDFFGTTVADVYFGSELPVALIQEEDAYDYSWIIDYNPMAYVVKYRYVVEHWKFSVGSFLCWCCNHSRFFIGLLIF
jgi:lipopolysaccharide transport system permease protein